VSADGATATEPTVRHGNVAAYLPEMAARQPDTLAVAVATGSNRDGTARYARLTALELDRRSDRIAHALVGVGIGEGVRAVLMVEPGVDFFALTFALLKVGAVPVMVDPGMGTKNLGTCLAEAEPEAFIGIPKAHAARVLLGWARKTVRTKVTVGRRLLWGGHALRRLEAAAPDRPYPVLEPDPEQTAAILFTSGSTGVPKGVVTPFRVFAAQVEALRSVYGIEPGERDLATFPLFALFGPALGMASIVPEMDASRPGAADPGRLLETVRDFACTNLFASPALIDKLGRHCADHDPRLSSLRRAISAGAPASAPALERFQRALPEGVEVLTSYGATEALPVSVMGSTTLLGDTRQITDRGGGVCVGRPVSGIDVRIIPIHDQPVQAWSADLSLPAGEIGEIVVRGAVVTPSYYKRPEATKLAKIPGADGELWHRMGDVGYFDEQGRLWMCGRKSHRVETDHGTLFTIPCEAVFNVHAAVGRSALVGVTRSARVEPLLCVERAPDHDLGPAELTRELLDIAKQHEHTRRIETVLYHHSFPVDVRHNAKIFREELAAWAQEQLP
jgi:acyl-CoA synthetase (AMP-forming)/AMP-acid ligase II